MVLHKCLVIWLALNAAGCWPCSSGPGTVSSFWPQGFPHTLFPVALEHLHPVSLAESSSSFYGSTVLCLDSLPLQMAFPDPPPEYPVQFLQNTYHLAVTCSLPAFPPKILSPSVPRDPNNSPHNLLGGGGSGQQGREGPIRQNFARWQGVYDLPLLPSRTDPQRGEEET